MTKFDRSKMKAARLERGLSAYALATVVGVHPNTIMNWEAGKGEPGVGETYKIAEALSVEFHDLLSEQV